MNFLHEIILTKHFTSEISLYKWELQHLYSYINVFSTEIALNFSEFKLDFGNRYLVIFNSGVTEGIPGQFVLYKRFFSQYSLDLEDFQNYPEMKTVIEFNFDSRKKQITIIGLSDEKIMRMRFGIRSFRIEINNPMIFEDSTIPFEFEFYNKNTFKLQLKFINSSKLSTDSDNTRKLIFYFLLCILSFCFVAIFVLLLLTVFLSKRKEELILELEFGIGAEDRELADQSNEGSFRISSMRVNRRS